MKALEILLYLLDTKISPEYPSSYLIVRYPTFTRTTIFDKLNNTKNIYNCLKYLFKKDYKHYFIIQILKSGTSTSIVIELKYYPTLEAVEFTYCCDDNIKKMHIDIIHEYNFLKNINY
jgi:hypothetical protein